MSLEKVGTTTRGYDIFKEPTEVGGCRYWSDEIGGGVVIFDSSLVCVESIEIALKDLKNDEA